MLDHAESMFDNMQPMMNKLKKAGYKENMEEFIRTYGHYFREMTDYTSQAEDKEAAANELAVCFAGQIDKAFYNGKKKRFQGAMQADLNFFMIYYVFPALLKTEHEDAKLIADTLCTVWNRQFKHADISYTDYDSIYNSFREKLFGII